MNLRKIKRMAAQLLGVGESKVWIDPAQLSKAKEAMTKEDVRGMFKDGIVKKKDTPHHSKGRARILHGKKTLGRKRGYGKRRGLKSVRTQLKTRWIEKVRAQRKKLRDLRKNNKIKHSTYAEIYRRVKGNFFRGTKHLEEFATTGKI